MLGFAAGTSVLVLALLWPKTTLADKEEDGFTEEGTKVEHVILKGEIVKDPKTASGWSFVVEARNEGVETETAEVETDLTRTVASSSARILPMPTAVMRVKETFTIAAGKSVTRHYAVTPQLAAQIVLARQINDRLHKAMERGNYEMPQRVTSFDVMFKGKWAPNGQTNWEIPTQWASEPYGNVMSSL
jgi:hypothetical protein